MTRILITGGAGFIGSALAGKLAGEGHEVTILDNLSRQIHGADPSQSPLVKAASAAGRLIVGDVTDADALAAALEGQEVVVHLAAETGTGQSMYQIDHYSRVNIGGTALLLDLVARNRGALRRIVVASSRAIYGEGRYRSEVLGPVWPAARLEADMAKGLFEPQVPGGGVLVLEPTDEDSRIHPTSVYGITKQVQEQLVLVAGGALGVEAVSLRYQNVYGPGQSLSNPYTGILSIFSNRILAGEGINIFEDGLESRDFVYIDDVVAATCQAIFSADAAGNAINVGTGTPTSVMTVATTLARLYGKDVPIEVSGNFRIGDIRHNYADLTRARALLNFEPKVDFETGIGRFAQWVLAQGAVESSYEQSLQEMRERGLLK
jgi:dTDP-L-rhamnose 4-epimerase